MTLAILINLVVNLCSLIDMRFEFEIGRHFGNFKLLKYTNASVLGFCEIKELSKVEGEASANNRKAKLFFFYEWELKADWKGSVLLLFYIFFDLFIIVTDY